MKLTDLRPGMEGVDLRVELLRLDDPRQVTTNYGVTHTLVEGEVEDETGKMDLTVWNEQIKRLGGLKVGDVFEVRNCFITSFQGVLSVNVGRDSDIVQPKRVG